MRDSRTRRELDDIAVFCRGVDPTAIDQVTPVGVNDPIPIGRAAPRPGDVALRSSAGFTVVPPHLVEDVVGSSEDIRRRDVVGKRRLHEGVCTADQSDVPVWAPPVEYDDAG